MIEPQFTPKSNNIIVKPQTPGEIPGKLLGGDILYEVFIIRRDGTSRTYSKVQTMSFSGSRIILTFKDGSMIKVRPEDLYELRTTSNVRRV